MQNRMASSPNILTNGQVHSWYVGENIKNKCIKDQYELFKSNFQLNETNCVTETRLATKLKNLNDSMIKMKKKKTEIGVEKYTKFAQDEFTTAPQNSNTNDASMSDKKERKLVQPCC